MDASINIKFLTANFAVRSVLVTSKTTESVRKEKLSLISYDKN